MTTARLEKLLSGAAAVMTVLAIAFGIGGTMPPMFGYRQHTGNRRS